MYLPIIIPICHKDEIRARLLFKWMVRLGRQPATITILLERRVPNFSHWLDGIFDKVTVLQTKEFDQCHGGGLSSDYALRTARKLYRGLHFLYTEPDAVPMVPNWVEQLLHHHGPDLTSTMSGSWTQSADYVEGGWFLNGVALYPVRYSPVPFPPGCYGSDRTNSVKHHPHLSFKANEACIHIYCYEGNFLPTLDGSVIFPTYKEVEDLLAKFPHLALFHRCYNTTLLDRLLEKS